MEHNSTQGTQAQKLFFESSESFRYIVETASDAIITINSQGIIFSWNQSAQRLFGFSAGEMIGKELTLIMPERFWEAFQAGLHRIVSTGKSRIIGSNIETVGLQKDGAEFPIEISLAQWKTSQGTFFTGNIRNISQRKIIETEIKAKVTQFELITQVGQTTTTILALNELLQQAVNLIRDSFGYYNTTVFLVDENTLILSATTLKSAQAMIGQFHLPIDSGSISGWVAKKGEPLLVPDVGKEPRYYQTNYSTETKSELAVPIKLKNKVLGILNVEQNKLNTLSESELFTMQTVANQLAVAIENAELFQQAQQEITERKQAEEAEHRQHVLADALRDTTTALNSTLELDEVLDRILVSIEHVVQHDAANIMLCTDNHAKMARTRGYIERGLEQWVADQSFPVDDVESMRQMRDTGKPQCVPDTHNHEGWIIYPETIWIRSSIGVPIMNQGETIGFIYIDSVKPNHFTPFHADRLLIFADQASVAIHNAQLFTAENRRRHIAENLRQAAATLNTSLELDEVLDIILQQLHEIADHDTVTIQQLEGDNLTITACKGFDKPDKLLGLQFPLQPKFPNARVVAEKKPLAVDNVAQDYPHFHDEASTFESGHILSWLGVPLLAREKIIGIISLDRSEMRAYTDQDIEIVTAFANQAAIAIENARLYEQAQQEIAERKQAEDALREMAEKLEYQAKHDHLTNLPNRLYFEEALQTALSKANESKRLVGLLYIDLDRFKRINDTLGHDTGDALLQQVARRLENQIRSSDTLARMGGDEFAMILGSLQSPQDAAHIARRLIAALEETITVESHELFITASIGISLYPRDGNTSEELLRKADTALYRSKDKGRDTFQIYTIDFIGNNIFEIFSKAIYLVFNRLQHLFNAAKALVESFLTCEMYKLNGSPNFLITDRV